MPTKPHYGIESICAKFSFEHMEDRSQIIADVKTHNFRYSTFCEVHQCCIRFLTYREPRRLTKDILIINNGS